MIDYQDVQQFLAVFGICVARMVSACAIAPFMSKQLIPSQVRNGIVFSWGIIVYPMVAPTLDVDLGNGALFLGILIKEIFIGFLIGFMAAKVFWIVMSVGFFIDNQRGSTMASVFDPNAGTQTSPIGLMLQQAMIAMFYVSGGFLVFLAGLFQSYVMWPVGSFFPEFSMEFPTLILTVMDEMMLAIVLLAAPIVITMLLANVGLGLMNRFAPQLNVFFLAMPVKSLLGLVVLAMYLPILFGLFHTEFMNSMSLYEKLEELFV